MKRLAVFIRSAGEGASPKRGIFKIGFSGLNVQCRISMLVGCKSVSGQANSKATAGIDQWEFALVIRDGPGYWISTTMSVIRSPLDRILPARRRQG